MRLMRRVAPTNARIGSVDMLQPAVRAVQYHRYREQARQRLRDERQHADRVFDTHQLFECVNLGQEYLGLDMTKLVWRGVVMIVVVLVANPYASFQNSV